MDRLVYTALSGMRRAEFAQGLTANNLANAATIGFRRDTGAFEARYLEGQSFETRVQASEQSLATELDPGPATVTGGALDVALADGIMLAVAAPGGGEAYTRRGDLRAGPTGVLETGDGRAVLGGGGPITLPPAGALEMGGDGTIGFRPAGEPGAPMRAADKLKLVRFDAAAMRKGADGLFRRVDGGATPADASAGVRTGALEASNVSPVGSLVELIEQSRAFELQTKLVGVARDLDQASSVLMRLE